MHKAFPTFQRLIQTKWQTLLLRLELTAIRFSQRQWHKRAKRQRQRQRPKPNPLKDFSESCSSTFQGMRQLARAESQRANGDGTKGIARLKGPSVLLLALLMLPIYRLQMHLRQRLLLWFLSSNLLHQRIIPSMAGLAKRFSALVCALSNGGKGGKPRPSLARMKPQTLQRSSTFPKRT